MLKQLKMRPAAGLVAVSLGIASIGLVVSRPAMVMPRSAGHQDGESWRLHRLAFLTAAYDRLEVDLQRDGDGPGGASLRRERDTIVQLIRDTARPLAAEQVPSEVGELLEARAQPAAPVAASAAAAPTPAPALVAPDTVLAGTEAPAPVVLAAGLRATRGTPLDITMLARDPSLSLPTTLRAIPVKHAKAAVPATGEPAAPVRKVTSGQGSSSEPRPADRAKPDPKNHASPG